MNEPGVVAGGIVAEGEGKGERCERGSELQSGWRVEHKNVAMARQVW